MQKHYYKALALIFSILCCSKLHAMEKIGTPNLNLQARNRIRHRIKSTSNQLQRDLADAIESKNYTKMAQLIICGANINEVNAAFSRGGVLSLNTALTYAAGSYFFSPNYKTIKLLLDCDVDINQINSNGENALYRLVRCTVHNEETIEIARLLIDYGIDVNNKNKFDQTTALMHAAKRKNSTLVELLLKSGADGEVKDKNNRTAADYFPAKCVVKRAI